MTGLVDHQYALDALGVESDGDHPDDLVRTMIGGCTRAIENRCGPMISRSLATLAESTVPRLVLDDATTGRELAELYRLQRAGHHDVTVGTDADPWAHVPVAQLLSMDSTTVTIADCIGPAGAVVPAGATLRAGRFVDLDDVPEEVTLAAMHVIRNRWVTEHGAASGAYDPNAQPSPWVIPLMALELLGDYVHLGIA